MKIVNFTFSTFTSLVGQWLEDMGYLHYEHLFLEHGIEDLETLRDITDEDLKEMGIKKMGIFLFFWRENINMLFCQKIMVLTL